MPLQKYEDLLKKEYKKLIGSRKVIVLGTGSLFRKMERFFNIDIENDVDFFVESYPSQKTFRGKQLISTEKLSSHVNKDEKAFVLVSSSAWSEIKETLGQELLQYFDWYAPYDLMSWIFNKDKLPIVMLEQNIHRLLVNYEGDIPVVQKESIAIMVGERSGNSHPYHAITLGVLLRLKGLHVQFLFNDLSDFGELRRGIGFNDFQNQILENLLRMVSDKYGVLFEKMSEQKMIGLTESEFEKVQQFIYYNKVWQSRKVMFDFEDEELKESEAKWLSNAQLSKGFLAKHDFNKVYVWTGVHSEWAALRILAEERNIKVYSSEYIRGGYSFSINGPTVFQQDINLFNDYQFNAIQKGKMLELANSHANQCFPEESTDKFKQPFVLMPLNIFWDSASYADNDVFIYFDKWLTETIQFLIGECKVHVYVRQHPYERNFDTGRDVSKLLHDLFGQHPLFHFIDASSEEDTYQLIKSAKVVLPNTSTVGVESAMMGKQVIVKNSVYYANSNFVLSAESKDEYFKLIKKSLTNEKQLSEKEIEKAKLYYALTISNNTNPFFGHWLPEVKKWSEGTLEELLNNEAAQSFLNAIIFDIPLLNNHLGIEVEK